MLILICRTLHFSRTQSSANRVIPRRSATIAPFGGGNLASSSVIKTLAAKTGDIVDQKTKAWVRASQHLFGVPRDAAVNGAFRLFYGN
jgi:hypothetical protein